jgi:hypothetical protein
MFHAVISEDCREVTSIPKNAKREVVAVNNYNSTSQKLNDPHHHVLKVILRNGHGCYALDMAGAQYGYYDQTTPWDEYMESRVLRVVGSETNCGNEFLNCHEEQENQSWDGAIAKLNVAMTPLLERTMKEGIHEIPSPDNGTRGL